MLAGSIAVVVIGLAALNHTCAYQLCHPNVLLMETVEPPD